MTATIVTTWFPLPEGHVFARHTHPEHQLVWASEGVVAVTIDDLHWVLPRSRALWIPAGTPHRTVATSRSLLGGIYIPAARCPVRWRTPTVVDVPPLLAELLVHLADDRARGRARLRAEAVVFDLLEPTTVSTLRLPMPVDDRAARVATELMEDPTNNRTLSAWGRVVGASGRTLARAFLADTGMTFGVWRTQMRVSAALGLLASGATVAATAWAVGYANPSAFIVAFRRSLGVSPGSYFARPDAPSDR